MKWLTAFLIVLCVILSESVIEGIALSCTPRAEVPAISIAVEASSTDAGSSLRIAASDSAWEESAMTAVTRETLAIAAWILAVLFMFCVVAYVIYHLHARKRNL